MKRLLLLAFTLIAFNYLQAQMQADVEDFESFGLERNTFLNNGGSNGGFQSNNVFLPNTFTSSEFGDFWSGWSISTMRDSVTSGFTNQYSAKPASGFDGSATYAVGFGTNLLKLTEKTVGTPIDGLYLTNNTYAYNSMRDGDAFAKRFGGETGNDPDFFRVTIKSYSEGTLSQDSVLFYLADYRFEDNSQDYIVDTWEYVDLTLLGSVDSLAFSFESSDVGDFGINTPLYICVDQITFTQNVSSTSVAEELGIEIYPNPTSDFIHIKSPVPNLKWSLLDHHGRLLKIGSNELIDLTALARGMYFVSIEGKGVVLPVVKQ